MKVVLQTAFFWCVLATLVPCVNSATLDSSDVTKRLSVWLQSRAKRDVHSVSDASEAESAALVRPQESRSTDTSIPQHRAETSIRVRRTINSVKRPGCNLVTCSVHDLAHRLHQLGTKLNSAPPEKIGSSGYGRRRRSLPQRRATLIPEGGRLRLAWAQKHRLGALLRRT